MRHGFERSGRSRAALALGVAAALALAGGAGASVSFDDTSGTGFVGKGDLQTPWGWNNQRLQAEASSVGFAYTRVGTTDYAVTCAFDTGTRHVVHHVVTTQRSLVVSVAAAVGSASRKNPRGDVTGFQLLGFGAATTTVSGGPVPHVGDGCPGNSGLGSVTDVEITSSTAAESLAASDAAAGVGPTSIWSS